MKVLSGSSPRVQLSDVESHEPFRYDDGRVGILCRNRIDGKKVYILLAKEGEPESEEYPKVYLEGAILPGEMVNVSEASVIHLVQA